MRRALLLLLFPACAGQYRVEHVGAGLANGDGLVLPQGTYDLSLRFDTPRAQLVQWTVSCPGATLDGSLCEPFDAYRTRRLAQLTAEREDQRRREAQLTGAVVGALVPGVEAHASAPGAGVDARVSPGDAAAAAVASQPVEAVRELPPGDTGGGVLQTVVHVQTAGDGACTVRAIADEAITGSFDVTRVRDLDAEARVRVMAANTAARQLRVQLKTQLTALGADATLLAKRREAEAHARLEAEAHARIEANARLEAEAHARWEAEAPARRRAQLVAEHRQVALNARATIIAWLTACGADPDRRARLVAEARAEREAREARLQIELRERQEREAQAAAAEAGRADLALHVRGDVVASLEVIGAHARPPMPPPREELRGEAPFAGAVWIAGSWIWDGGTWTWRAGGWRDSSRFSDAGGEAAVPWPVVEVTTSPQVETATAVGVPTVEVHDHRSPTPPPSSPVVRDHRTEPKVRDHRR